MKKGLVFMLICVSGCATQKSINLPDGSQGYSIDCSGQALNWGLCYEKAGQLCKDRGYDVVNKGGEETPMRSPAYSGMFVHRSLLIRCK